MPLTIGIKNGLLIQSSRNDFENVQRYFDKTKDNLSEQIHYPDLYDDLDRIDILR